MKQTTQAQNADKHTSSVSVVMPVSHPLDPIRPSTSQHDLSTCVRHKEERLTSTEL